MLIEETHTLEHEYDWGDSQSQELFFYSDTKNPQEIDFENLCIDPRGQFCSCKKCYRVTIFPSDENYEKLKRRYFEN